MYTPELVFYCHWIECSKGIFKVSVVSSVFLIFYFLVGLLSICSTHYLMWDIKISTINFELLVSPSLLYFLFSIFVDFLLKSILYIIVISYYRYTLYHWFFISRNFFLLFKIFLADIHIVRLWLLFAWYIFHIF